jgi:hypothetical protein
VPRKVVQLAASSGGAPFVIADDSLGRAEGSRQLVRMSPNFDAAVRDNAAFRAPEIEHFAQDDETYNESTSYDLEVSYCFRTEDELAAFQRQVQRDLRPVGNIEITAAGITWYLVNAKCRPIATVREDAVHWLARFSITGGKLADSLPATRPQGGQVPI